MCRLLCGSSPHIPALQIHLFEFPEKAAAQEFIFDHIGCVCMECHLCSELFFCLANGQHCVLGSNRYLVPLAETWKNMQK